MKPIYKITGHDAFSEAIDIFCSEFGTFIALLIRVDSYTDTFASRGVLEAEGLMAMVCNGLEQRIGAAHSVRRLDQKTVGVVVATRSWFDSRANKEVVGDVLKAMGLQGQRGIRYAHVVCPEQGKDSVTVLDNLRAFLPPVWRSDTRGSGGVEVEIGQMTFSDAFRRREIETYFQPVYFTSGKLRGYEALSRWRHPVEGLVPPAHYMEKMTNQGYSVDLFKVNLEKAVEIVHRSRAELDERVICSINVEPQTFVDSEFQKTLKETARKCPPECIELEIIESEAIDTVQGLDTAFRYIREMGYRIAVDDFGSRYAWLNSVRKQVSTVKLDMAVVRQAAQAADPQSDVNSQIISAVVDACKKHGVCVVAEGIEEHTHLNAMKRLGVDAVQGYGIAKPLAMDDAIKSVAQRKARKGLAGRNVVEFKRNGSKY